MTLILVILLVGLNVSLRGMTPYCFVFFLFFVVLFFVLSSVLKVTNIRFYFSVKCVLECGTAVVILEVTKTLLSGDLSGTNLRQNRSWEYSI